LAGHSRWAQVKHKKALTDAKKGKTFSKIARMITVASKEKGADPETNPALRTAIEKARALGMPSDNIERAILRGSGVEAKDALAAVQYEVFGPGGAAFLISGITDNKNRTTSEIKHILAEHGGCLADRGAVEWLFRTVRTIELDEQEQEIKGDELELVLIDAGAEDIGRDGAILIARFPPERIPHAKSILRQRAVTIRTEYADSVPKTRLEIENTETKHKISELLEKLDDHDDMQEIYTNVNL